MNNKKVIVGVAAGVAILAVAGILLSKKRKSKKQRFIDKAEDLTSAFKGKLNNLQRKAEKEFKHLKEEGGDLANAAKERAGNWIDKAGATL